MSQREKHAFYPPPSSGTETLEVDEGQPRSVKAPADGVPTAEAPTVEVGDILEGRYRYEILQSAVGNGLGSVFEARRLPVDAAVDADIPPELVAIKVLGPTRDLRATNTLKRELAALLAIEHDRIPKLYDWSVEGEVAFAVLEFFPAGSLADAWCFFGRFDEERTWRLIADLLSALRAAHRESILHLDVKPSNVLMDGNGGYVLTDFGVAQAARMSKGLMHQGRLAISMGTHGYRAPEQGCATLQSFDLRTDLWGVGATAWALYTGIDLNKRRDVLRNKESGNIYGLQRLSDVRLHCPPPLEELIMDLLYIDPAQRPGGAEEVLRRVKSIATGFRLGSRTVTAARRSEIDAGEIQAVIDSLVDPLWSSIARTPGFERHFVKFEDGEVISRGAEGLQHTLLLLKGRIRVEKRDALVAVESREGTFLGAISTLGGAPQEASLTAEGLVWGCLFNEAELEQLVTCNPAVAVRMVRNMAKRIGDGPPRQND